MNTLKALSLVSLNLGLLLSTVLTHLNEVLSLLLLLVTVIYTTFNALNELHAYRQRKKPDEAPGNTKGPKASRATAKPTAKGFLNYTNPQSVQLSTSRLGAFAWCEPARDPRCDERLRRNQGRYHRNEPLHLIQ